MSRLDRHVTLVQNKLAVQRFVDALIDVLPLAVSAALVARLIQRQTTLPVNVGMWCLAIVGVSVVGALWWAIRHRPGSHDAAVAIDERLGLKEKFSTALAMRHVNDPFAAAAVCDAENTADQVSLYKRFPLTAPRSNHWRRWAMTAVIAAVALLLPKDAFQRQADARIQAAITAERAAVKQSIANSIARVRDVTKVFPGDKEAINAALADLLKLQTADLKDPDATRLAEATILTNLDQAIRDEIKRSREVADKAATDRTLAGLQAPAAKQEGPVADVHRDLAANSLDKAMADLKDLAGKFDKMSPEEKARAADQMDTLARDLAKQAGNQPGSNGQQQPSSQLADAAREMADAMKQAANGNGPPNAGQQELAAAEGALKDALAKMDAVAKDAEQQQAAAKEARDAARQAAAQLNKPGDGKPGDGLADANNNPNGNPPNPKNGKGQGDPAQADGGLREKHEAPFDVAQRTSPSQDQDGQLIASTLVKGGAIDNKAMAKLQAASASAERAETDDVDSDRITGEAKRAVKDYFGQISTERAK